MPTQTFRYLACGGSNTVLNILIDYIAFNFILHRQYIHMYGSWNVAPEVGAWVIAFAISFPAGFVLSRYIVFPESNMHGRIQLFRYALTTIFFILLTYVLIKVFSICIPMVNQTVRYTFICIFTAVLSYITQRKFTFKSVAVEMD
jgi:putative flippase GtrA